MPTGLIGGSNLHNTPLFRNAQRKTIETPYGSVEVYLKEKLAFIPRHGSRGNTPPHMVNHRANISAMHKLTDSIIGLCMTGSLSKKIKPHAIVIPHDYVNLWNIQTLHDDKAIHLTPTLDEKLRKLIIKTAEENKIKIREKGVYVQTTGPRLETKAEIKILKDYGDIVGMTMASEATLAQELGLSYAAICSVDNYANGISKNPLDFRKVLDEASKNTGKILKLAAKTAEKLR